MAEIQNCRLAQGVNCAAALCCLKESCDEPRYGWQTSKGCAVATLATHVFNKGDREEEQRLESLFMNRAELKREFEQQRRETERFAEKLRQQEIATLRAEQNLEKLERMLADSATAYQAMAYYQLRSLWMHCRKRLQRAANDLYEAACEHERLRLVKEYEAGKSAAIQDIRNQLNEQNGKSEALAAKIDDLRCTRDGMRGFWNVFRRREITARIAELNLARQASNKQVELLIAATEEEAAGMPPAFPGLSVTGKREMNLALIALAQELVLWFRDDKLAELARETSICQVTDARYGAARDCREVGKLVRNRIQELALDNNLAVRVKSRSDYLASIVSYRNEYEAIPESSDLFEIVIDVKDSARIAPMPLNVLAMEYWDIFDALIQ